MKKEQQWHEVTEHHFNTYFKYNNYTHSTDCGLTDFYKVILSNGEYLEGMIKVNVNTHKTEYFIKY